MPRKLRIQEPGAFYHVMSRGNNQQKIFLSDDDRVDFLEIFATVVSDYSWVCHAYCLMGNHYHLLIETPEANISEGMQRLNGDYCRGFNKKHGRVGHVLQGRYLSYLVENEKYFLALLRYIPLNPVSEGLVDAPENWRWSSYKATVGLALSPPFLEAGSVLSIFAEDPTLARDAYSRFVAGGLEEHAGGSGRSILLESLFGGVNNKERRNSAICIAYQEHCFSAQEIANYLDLSIATVYRVIAK